MVFVTHPEPGSSKRAETMKGWAVVYELEYQKKQSLPKMSLEQNENGINTQSFSPSNIANLLSV